MGWKKIKSGPCKGMYSMPLSEYFKIINPKYSVLKIIPDTSIRNYDSESIARVICNMYSIPLDRIDFKKIQFTYKLPQKTSFFIDISTKEVNFYIITPEDYEKLIMEKCSTTWPKATIKKVDSIRAFSKDSLKYELHYKKEDGLSLKVDKRSNDPLNNILNVLDIMEQDDRVGVYYNFIPIDQQRWRNKHAATLEKVKNNMLIDKQKISAKYIIFWIVDQLMSILTLVIEEVSNFIGEGKSITVKDKVNTAGMSMYERLSNSTIIKGERNVIDTQLVVLSDSESDKRKRNNALSVCESYKCISEDNSLVYKPIKSAVYFTEYEVRGITKNTMSTEEATNFLQIPGRALLSQYQHIEKVDVLENPLPDELRFGYINLGKTTYRGVEQDAFLRDEYNQGNLPLCAIGPQGTGKTTFFANYVSNAHKRRESVLVIDFIKNCELANAIEKVIPPQDLLILNLGESSSLQGLGYNEIKLNNNMNDFDKLELANLQAQQTMALIDAINNEGLALTSKMRRYLSSAANVVFLNQNSNIRDVINCLQDFRKREYYISRIPDGLRDQLEDEINTLRELDEITVSKDKETKEVTQEITGTRDSKIDGILDRVNLLKEDSKLKYMFNKTLEGNIDLVEEIEKGKVILIKMPELKFPLAYVKNVLVTYYVTKYWLSLQLRGANYEKPKRSHIIVDEIYQAPTCEKIFRVILPQTRKFGGKAVFSCHYLSQIEPIKEPLKASGSSFMLFQGTDKKNYEELREELQPYELEDLLNLKQYHSLNLIKYEKGYAKFITKLPPPIK